MDQTKIKRGKLIVIEGADGSGKSTVSILLSGALQELGNKIEIVNILKDTPCALSIRNILTNPDSVMHADTEACLYVAAILNTYHTKIEALLAEGTHVICDRSHISAWAYQIYPQVLIGNHIPSKIFEAIRDIIIPDILCMMFVDPTLGLKRVIERDGKHDRIELRGEEYQKIVSDGYRAYLKEENHSTNTLEYHNNGSQKELFEFVHNVIEAM